eukprot:522156-Ditylum_brightwellii.AAC.1
MVVLDMSSGKTNMPSAAAMARTNMIFSKKLAGCALSIFIVDVSKVTHMLFAVGMIGNKAAVLDVRVLVG